MRIELWDKHGVPWKELAWPDAPLEIVIPALQAIKAAWSEESASTALIPIVNRHFRKIQSSYDGLTTIYREVP